MEGMIFVYRETLLTISSSGSLSPLRGCALDFREIAAGTELTAGLIWSHFSHFSHFNHFSGNATI